MSWPWTGGPVFYGGQAQYVLLRKDEVDSSDAWQVFPDFRRRYQEADFVIQGIQKKYANLRRELGLSLDMAMLTQPYVPSPPGGPDASTFPLAGKNSFFKPSGLMDALN